MTRKEKLVRNQERSGLKDAQTLLGGLFGIAGIMLLTGAFRANRTVLAPILAKGSEGLSKIALSLLEKGSVNRKA